MRKWWEFVLEGGTPGAGALEEEVEPESFDVKDTLSPAIWPNNEEMDPKVRSRLLAIALDFLDELDVDVEPDDVRLTGSLANYNWSDYSDIDLHIVVDFRQIDADEELVKKFFDASRLRWNDKHDIQIYGHEVETYVENVGEEHHSSGIFSLSHNEWLVEPDPDDAKNAWSVAARKKSDDILTQINLIKQILRTKPKAALRSIERLKKKINNIRKAGLASEESEYSTGNIVFKILRREDALKTLSDLKTMAYDAAFSMG